jgi:hypothetical protein
MDGPPQKPPSSGAGWGLGGLLFGIALGAGGAYLALTQQVRAAHPTPQEWSTLTTHGIALQPPGTLAPSGRWAGPVKSLDAASALIGALRARELLVHGWRFNVPDADPATV